MRANRGADTLDPRQFRHLPTSIETLRIDSPELLALLAMKPGDPDVRFHSVIGALRPGPIASTTDGVVAYRSTHFEGAESERVVRSDHGVQKAPEAILEVRRILLEHVRPAPQAASAPGRPRRPLTGPTHLSKDAGNRSERVGPAPTGRRFKVQ